MPIKDKRFRPIVSTFLDQSLSEFYQVANKNKGKLPIPVQCIFDEFNNVGKLNSYEETISTVREDFCKWKRNTSKNQDETPYSEIGRNLYRKRTRKRLHLARADDILSLHYSELIAQGKTNKLL